jgi:hypothetical protein
LIHPENPKLEHNEEYDDIYTSKLPMSPIPPWERIIKMRNQRMKLTILSQESWNSPQTWMPDLNGRLLI